MNLGQNESRSIGVGRSSDQPRNILVITYWSFADALIQTYTLPYLRIMLRCLPEGSHIHLVTLEKSDPRAWAKIDEAGISLHRYRYRPLGAKGAGMILGLIALLWKVMRDHKVDTIHAWCTPAGMIGHLLAKLTSKPLVLDSFEPHAEAMVENGTWPRKGLAFRVLFHFEKKQARQARAVIAAASGMRAYALEKYGVDLPAMQVKPACVDLERFSLDRVKDPVVMEQLGLKGKLVVVYAGKFGGIYLDQEVFDLLRVARDHWGERFHVLLLTGHSVEELTPFIVKAGLSLSLFTITSVPHSEVPVYMGVADMALTPVRSVPTKRNCTPIKDGEYWALGLPVIITPGISDDSEIIERNGIGVVLDGLDRDAYQRAVERMDALLSTSDPAALRARIRAIAEKYRHFRIAEQVYRNVYGTTG